MKIVFCVNDASFTRCRDNAVDNAQVAKICHQNITLFIYKKKKKRNIVQIIAALDRIFFQQISLNFI